LKGQKKQLVIPVFIPHQGCPHQCLFCNQRSITGIQEGSEEIGERITATIDEWLWRSQKNYARIEVAFYGGSFTCIPVEKQRKMLGVVQPYLGMGKVDSIRLSTRPDCVDPAICEHLSSYGVTTVELGVQSLDDTILHRSERGHNAQDCSSAVEALKEVGIEVGIQLMPGLPGETTLTFLRTIKKTITLQPSLVRLYPVLVVKGSGLEEQFAQGVFQPLSLNKAIALTGKAKELFDKFGIRVIRMGLQPSQSLEDELLAGPYHPSFGELVMSRFWFKRVRRMLSEVPEGFKVEVHISHKDVSAFVGMGKRNYKRLAELELLDKMILVTEKNMERGSLYHVIC
jgi:histone acetyltransferase (RNA polymerase elongator complex component)